MTGGCYNDPRDLTGNSFFRKYTTRNIIKSCAEYQSYQDNNKLRDYDIIAPNILCGIFDLFSDEFRTKFISNNVRDEREPVCDNADECKLVI